MSTYTSTIHQIVYSTKKRRPTLKKENRNQLYKFLWSICERKKCQPYAINGTEDHLHIILAIHPTIAVSDLVKELKISSSFFIKENGIFPGFDSWQTGYGLFAYHVELLPKLIRYTENQEIHHKKISSKDELRILLQKQRIDYDEKYFE
jgi:putative transposase